MQDFLYAYGVLFGVINMFGFIVFFVALVGIQIKQRHLNEDFRIKAFLNALIVVFVVSFFWMPITLVQTLRGMSRVK